MHFVLFLTQCLRNALLYLTPFVRACSVLLCPLTCAPHHPVFTHNACSVHHLFNHLSDLNCSISIALLFGGLECLDSETAVLADLLDDLVVFYLMFLHLVLTVWTSLQAVFFTPMACADESQSEPVVPAWIWVFT